MWFECFVISVIYGVMPTINKHLLSIISVDSFVCFIGLIHFVVVLFYLSVYKTNLKSDFNKMTNRDLFILIASTTSVYLVANTYYFSIMQSNKPFLITAVMSSSPVVITLLLGYLLYNEKFDVKHLLGVALFIAAITVINS